MANKKAHGITIYERTPYFLFSNEDKCSPGPAEPGEARRYLGST